MSQWTNNPGRRWYTKMILDSQLDKFQEGTVYLWTDGSCISPRDSGYGPAGFAAYMFGWYTDAEGAKWCVWREDMGSMRHSTNIRAELQAVILGLSLVARERDVRIVLYTDSKYVVDGATQYLPKWKQKNGVKSNGDPVAHWDLWLHLDNFLRRHHVTFEHTKAHADDEWNNRVDAMANWMARNPGSHADMREGKTQLTPGKSEASSIKSEKVTA